MILAAAVDAEIEADDAFSLAESLVLVVGREMSSKDNSNVLELELLVVGMIVKLCPSLGKLLAAILANEPAMGLYVGD